MHRGVIHPELVPATGAAHSQLQDPAQVSNAAQIVGSNTHLQDTAAAATEDDSPAGVFGIESFYSDQKKTIVLRDLLQVCRGDMVIENCANCLHGASMDYRRTAPNIMVSQVW